MVASKYFPHLSAGFRSNPFRALTDSEWSDCAIVSEEVEAAFRYSRSHIQLLGGMGAGKTTTLLGLGRLAEGDGIRADYEYIADGQSRFSTDLAVCGLVFLDEAQRLSQLELARLLNWCTGPAHGSGRRAVRLVFASHRDLTTQFRRRGLPLATFSVDRLPLAGWRAFLDARLASIALPGRPHATISDAAVALLAQEFGANRRAAVAFLYEIFQQLRAPVIVDAANVRAASAAITTCVSLCPRVRRSPARGLEGTTVGGGGTFATGSVAPGAGMA